ncbi:MAG TPA: YeeE/YedE thiosulfate transporter family protein [Phycisphaerales bacterium]|nr:YeeE/YedE thiosulfate transporter family protein [Phycisphaerales bacterium]HRQ75701.1 YeeE/YedE thiosulfate transporter family protein [Phycisphaerales bacterium]
MFDPIFADPQTLALGALTGFIFGFLLQKSGVTRFNVILGQFLLKDFTVIKVMGTAIVVGAIGIYGMRAMGIDFPMHIKNATLLGNAIGGLIFGVGMAVLGYCPGTAVAAAGDGSRHAIFGILGGIAGAGLYAEAHPWVQQKILGVSNLEKATLATQMGLSPWWIIALLAVAAAVGFYMLERKTGTPPRAAH